VAKFIIKYVALRDEEEIEADYYEDHPPFVDFKAVDPAGGDDLSVARYRAEDIRRILRR